MSLFSSSSIFVRGAVLVLFVGLAVGAAGCDGSGSASEPPAAPSGVQATSEDGAVALTWEGATDATGYNVYRSTNPIEDVEGGPLNGEAPVDQTFYTDSSAENGTRYYYRVTAVGDGGESDPSSEVSARPFPSPPADRP